MDIQNPEAVWFFKPTLLPEEYSGRLYKRTHLITQGFWDKDNLLKELWWHLIEEYTSRWLTRGNDKLNAIGGLTNYLQRKRSLRVRV
jgi:hypothetical protein